MNTRTIPLQVRDTRTSSADRQMPSSCIDTDALVRQEAEAILRRIRAGLDKLEPRS